METLTTLDLVCWFGFEYEPGHLFCCYWSVPGLRIRQVLATQFGEAAVPPDLFETLDGIPLRTVQELEQLLGPEALQRRQAAL